MRALVICLGEVLAPVMERLDREYSARRDSGMLQSAGLELLDAPVAAVGNLSHPVQLLRENLEADLYERLGRLLELSPNRGEDFVLDVFVLLNLGEPLAANATRVIIEMLARIVDAHFRAIFPTHQVGTARRFRILPIAILPAAPDCVKDRSDAVDELTTLHDFFTGNGDADPVTAVDRLFLLDAMTSRGIAPRGDLVDQLLGFLRLTILGGVRREVDFVGLFESERNDLFASFGVACAEVDFLAIRDELTRQLTASVAEVLGREESCVLPGRDELLPVRVLDDAAALDMAIAELEGLPRRTLEQEGSSAAHPLLMLYRSLLQRVDEWREVDDEETELEVVEADDESGGAAAIGLAVGVLSGAAIGVAAHLLALVSVTVAAASGGGFALFAFLLTWLVLRNSDEPAEARRTGPATTVEAERRAAMLDALEHTIDDRRSKLAAIVEGFAAIARAFSLPEESDDAERTAGTFRDDLVSPELLELVSKHTVETANARTVADQWLAEVGDWRALLEGGARAEAGALAQYCAAEFLQVGAEPLFADTDRRERVSVELDAFIEKWSEGIAVLLEGESRKQFDPDGFYAPLTHTVFAPRELAADIESSIKSHGAVLRLHKTALDIDDIFVLSTIADVHPDAVSAIADNHS